MNGPTTSSINARHNSSCARAFSRPRSWPRILPGRLSTGRPRSRRASGRAFLRNSMPRRPSSSCLASGRFPRRFGCRRKRSLCLPAGPRAAEIQAGDRPNDRMDFMFKHILVPVDGSANSRRAVEAAAELVKCHRSSVTLLHVIPDEPLPRELMKMIASGEITESHMGLLRDSAEIILHDAEEVLGAAGG